MMTPRSSLMIFGATFWKTLVGETMFAAVFVEIARDGVYFLQTPSAGKLLAGFGYAVVTFSIGWVYFRARSMEISEEP